MFQKYKGKKLDDIPYKNFQEFLKYINSGVSTLEFPRVKERAFRVLADSSCPSTLKIAIGKWFFTKLYTMYRMPQNLREVTTKTLQDAGKDIWFLSNDRLCYKYSK